MGPATLTLPKRGRKRVLGADRGPRKHGPSSSTVCCRDRFRAGTRLRSCGKRRPSDLGHQLGKWPARFGSPRSKKIFPERRQLVVLASEDRIVGRARLFDEGSFSARRADAPSHFPSPRGVEVVVSRGRSRLADGPARRSSCHGLGTGPPIGGGKNGARRRRSADRRLGFARHPRGGGRAIAEKKKKSRQCGPDFPPRRALGRSRSSGPCGCRVQL